MTEPSDSCDRCQGVMVGESSRVRLESGPLVVTHPTLRLCPRCTDSLRRWIDRRSKNGKGGGGFARGGDPSDPRRHPPRGSPAVAGQREERFRGLVIFSVIFGTGLVAALVALAVLH